METVINKNVNGHRLAAVFNDAGTKKVVIFCHGFRSSSIGPNRFFVKAARLLAKNNISSLRFDQFGSGNSDGDFEESSFFDWIETTKALVSQYLEDGYKVALWGQSMGGSTVLKVAAEIPEIAAVVSWVPDASADEYVPNPTGYEEEEGQKVSTAFWLEAHSINFADELKKIKAPVYVVQCTDDEYVDEANRRIVSESAQPAHAVDVFEGYRHSKWTFDQADHIITKSVDFISERI